MKKTNPCPLCEGQKFSKVTEISSRQIVSCQSCDLVQVNPLPSKEQIEHHYDSDYFKNYDPYIANLSTHQAYFQKKLGQIEKRVGKKTMVVKLLDVGCALGVFLEMAKLKGWQTMGIEISKEAVEYCRKRGLQIFADTIEGIKLPENSFDLVTCFQTIEHAREPIELAQAVFRVLKKGGLAVFTTPSYDVWTRKLMGRFWFGYRHWEHLFFFTPKTLRLLFEKAGFSKIEVKKDEVRPFSLHYFFSRLAYYLPFWPFKQIFNLISRSIRALKVNVSIDPWGDLILFARKK